MSAASEDLNEFNQTLNQKNQKLIRRLKNNRFLLSVMTVGIGLLSAFNFYFASLYKEITRNVSSQRKDIQILTEARRELQAQVDTQKTEILRLVNELGVNLGDKKNMSNNSSPNEVPPKATK